MSAVAEVLDTGRSSRATSFFRVLFVGGMIAYRALFNWIRPAIYIPTMLGSPLFQILFFAHLGRYSGLGDTNFFVVGNAVQVSAMSAIYGATMTLANERYFGTIAQLLATPANRAALFLGRTLPVIANGLIVSTFGFLVGAVFLDFRMDASQIPAVALVVTLTVVSCTGLGMMLGSIGIRARDVFFASNLAYFMMLSDVRGEHPDRFAPGMDAGDLEVASAHPWDRRGAPARERRAPRRGVRPDPYRAADRSDLRVPRIRALSLLRGLEPKARLARPLLGGPEFSESLRMPYSEGFPYGR